MTPDQTARLENAFRENENLLVKWLTKRMGDHDAASDVAQAVYLRVWAYAATAIINNPRALIFKTAGNLALNEMKRRNKFNRKHVTSSDGDGEGILDNLAAAGPNPEREACLKEEVRETLDAIRALPEQPRQAFIMNRFDGLSYKEIAKRMKVSESSVEKYMIEALKRLRRTLKDKDTN